VETKKGIEAYWGRMFMKGDFS